MLVYDLLDGGVVFVESGGEGDPVAGRLGLVDEEVGSWGAGCFFFQDAGVLAGITSFLESFLKGGHGFIGLFGG